jgi:ribosomal protein S18 acetylase RimI-like enzyme
MMPLIAVVATVLLNMITQETGGMAKMYQEESSVIQVERGTLKSNLDQIVEVVNLAYRRQPFNRPDRDRISVAQLQEILLNPNNQLFLLCSGSRVYGTVLLNRSEISLLAVHPSMQGQGYGSQLLAAAEAEAFKNYDSVYLKVIPLFQEGLIAYYEKIGYRSYNECETFAHGKLDRIQEKYHDQVYALVLRKNRP